MSKRRGRRKFALMNIKFPFKSREKTGDYVKKIKTMLIMLKS